MTPPLAWVVGAGGLLGSQVAGALRRAGPLWSPPAPVPWSSARAPDVLAEHARRFGEAAGGGPWTVAWAAGAGFVGSDTAVLEAEAAALASLLRALAGGNLVPAQGALFLASSAGGVYAGSSGPPFDETTVPRPVSPYGQAKLRLEDVVADWSRRHGVAALVGRIGNLYGPGQDLRKPQGLVSQLCRAQLTRRPLAIYVPLDTVRDYVHARDCGHLVAAAMEHLRAEASQRGPGVQVKVLASQTGTTVADLVAEVSRVTHRKVPVVHALSGAARWQARDLRLRSVVWPDLDRRPRTTLAVGIREVLDGQLAALRRGALPDAGTGLP